MRMQVARHLVYFIGPEDFHRFVELNGGHFKLFGPVDSFVR